VRSALAAKLNVSRTPVREAVQQLIYEGIAVYTRNAGARVDSLDTNSIRAVFEVREVLDGLAAFHATAAATHEAVQQLKKMVQAHVSEALLRLDGQSHLYRSDMWSADLNRRLAVTEHERIVGAIESGDAVGARVAACAHVAGLLVRTTRT
jgi:DNA-binding GntR family transcriptional regulator